MGTIDKTTHTLTCQACDITEYKSVSEKGSGWGGGSWQSGPSFSKFETRWEGEDKVEPKLVQAKCNKCGETPESTSRYGGYN
jgi:hypothetical protein